jgi:hypothetical protein
MYVNEYNDNTGNFVVVFCDLMVSAFAIGPKVREIKTVECNQNCQQAFIRRASKAVGPMS